MMALDGKRLCCVDESEKMEKLAEGAVKNLTGGLEVTGRDLREKTRSFTPYFKIVLLTNNKPEISTDDYATERRLVLIPFLAKFVNHPKEPFERLLDKHKGDELIKNIDIFFSWLGKGAKKYYKDGLQDMPSVAADAKKQYYQDNDELGEFITTCCDITDPLVKTSTAELFEYFKEYSGHKSMNIRSFAMKLKEKGFGPTQVKDKHNHTNLRGFLGIAIKGADISPLPLFKEI